MEESSTYQLILSRGEARGEAMGEVKEEQKVLMRLGRKRFGEPEATMQKALQDLSLEQLEERLERLLEVENWVELLV